MKFSRLYRTRSTYRYLPRAVLRSTFSSVSSDELVITEHYPKKPHPPLQTLCLPKIQYDFSLKHTSEEDAFTGFVYFGSYRRCLIDVLSFMQN